MKARLTFYCAALVALVLILVAVPSHATERRDPLMMPDAQTQVTKSPASAYSAGKEHASVSHKSNGQAHMGPLSQSKAKSVVKKNSSASVKSNGGAQSGTATSSAAK